MSQLRGGGRARAWALALALVLVTLLLPRFAEASRPVIEPGREAEIVALFDPHALGDELAPGWTLHSFSIEIGTIHLWIAGPDDAYAHLTLDHPDLAPKQARILEGFALAIVEQPPGSEAAVASLSEALERNDKGQFWRGEIAYADEPTNVLGVGLGVGLGTWAKDGIVLLTLFTLVLLGLVMHKLRGAGSWMKWALLAIVLGGAALRLIVSPEVGLEAWPYTRFLLLARWVYEGPMLAILNPDPVWMSSAITTTTLVLALLAPLAIYVHARYLLDDHRVALIAAGIIAILPLHLRFAHSDVAFVASITSSSLVFTLVHVATREPKKSLGWFAVAIIGLPLALVYLIRPLNIMYFPLLVATAFVNHGVDSEKPRAERVRVGAAFAMVTIVTFAGGVPWLLESFGSEVRDGLSGETLLSALTVVFSPRMNILLNPEFTPPGLTALALLGVVDLWRRGKRPLLWFLVLWLFGFLAAHAYVVPRAAYMQARYHLHLIVPYMLLAACGAEAALRWLALQRDRKPWLTGRRYLGLIALLVAYACVSPLIHLHSIRNTEFNDAREWLFVHGLRQAIPAQCSVIEYIGDRGKSRLDRVGAYVEDGLPRLRWQVHAIAAPGPGEPEIPAGLRALLEDPPECLYWYEGMPCFGNDSERAGKAEFCDAIEGFVVLEKVAGVSFESEMYDENLARGLEPGDRVELSLFRAHRRPPRE